MNQLLTVQFIHCWCCRPVQFFLHQSLFPLCWIQQTARLRDLLNTEPVHASTPFLRQLRVASFAETETVFLSKLLQTAPCSSSCYRVTTRRQSTVLVHVAVCFLLTTAAEPTMLIELQTAPCSPCSCSRVTTRRRNIVPVHVAE